MSDVKQANAWQVGGEHYKVGGEEHWDRVARLHLTYFQAQVTKYLERWKRKNGVQDLEKALHFLFKYEELLKNPNAKSEGEGIADRALRLGLDYYQSRIIELVESPYGGVMNVHEAIVLLQHYIKIGKLSVVFLRAQDDGVVYPDDEDDEIPPPVVKPTGYEGYTYEGGTKDWDLYRCVICRREVKMSPIGTPPLHTCLGVAPTT